MSTANCPVEACPPRRWSACTGPSGRVSTRLSGEAIWSATPALVARPPRVEARQIDPLSLDETRAVIDASGAGRPSAGPDHRTGRRRRRLAAAPG